MSLVRAKKHLGQHFLTDKNIAAKIVGSLQLALYCQQQTVNRQIIYGSTKKESL